MNARHLVLMSLLSLTALPSYSQNSGSKGKLETIALHSQHDFDPSQTRNVFRMTTVAGKKYGVIYQVDFGSPSCDADPLNKNGCAPNSPTYYYAKAKIFMANEMGGWGSDPCQIIGLSSETVFCSGAQGCSDGSDDPGLLVEKALAEFGNGPTAKLEQIRHSSPIGAPLEWPGTVDCSTKTDSNGSPLGYFP
jgi:hypothetical protein